MSVGTKQPRDVRWRQRVEITSYLCVAAGLTVVVGNIYIFGAAHFLAAWGVGIYATGLAIHAATPLVRVPSNWLMRNKRRGAPTERKAVTDLQEPTV